MKIGIFAGGTSVRSKNIFTDISQYPTRKHEIKNSSTSTYNVVVVVVVVVIADVVVVESDISAEGRKLLVQISADSKKSLTQAPDLEKR